MPALNVTLAEPHEQGMSSQGYKSLVSGKDKGRSSNIFVIRPVDRSLFLIEEV